MLSPKGPQMMVGRGALVISLDFELHWGVRDTRPLATYGGNILGAREAIPRILSLFARYAVHATWATVGFLLCKNRDELMDIAPGLRPEYLRKELSPYSELGSLGRDELEDPYHYAPTLVRRIIETPGQELGTHTLSHYYCLEPGSSLESFRADLDAAVRLSSSFGVQPRSIVFPRNQYSDRHLLTCAEAGIGAFRGNPEPFFHRPRPHADEVIPIRLARLIDSYLPLSRNNARVRRRGANFPVEVPASRFLRPWIPQRALDRLRLRRVVGELNRAARAGGLFHLWWHPHNFGRNSEENLRGLEGILRVARRLRDSHGLRSMTMSEASTNWARV